MKLFQSFPNMMCLSSSLTVLITMVSSDSMIFWRLEWILFHPRYTPGIPLQSSAALSPGPFAIQHRVNSGIISLSEIRSPVTISYADMLFEFPVLGITFFNCAMYFSTRGKYFAGIDLASIRVVALRFIRPMAASELFSFGWLGAEASRM